EGEQQRPRALSKQWPGHTDAADDRELRDLDEADAAEQVDQADERQEQRRAIDDAARRGQLHRERDEQHARVSDRATVPRQRLERVRVDTAGEELVRLACIAREQALQVFCGQITRVGIEEVLETGGARRSGVHRRIPSSRPTLANTSSANCSSSRVCVAVTIVRTRAL